MPKKPENKLIKSTVPRSTKRKKKKAVGYKRYPANEDIYRRQKEEKDIDPEDTTKLKTPNEELRELNEKDFEEDLTGEDLDIPGTELDDEMEDLGSEDEENNYYSLGGDNYL
jgi:hypothetical protein